jgi:hypothetical protein
MLFPFRVANGTIARERVTHALKIMLKNQDLPPHGYARRKRPRSVKSAITLPIVWMVMAPIPVIALLSAGREVELAIVSVPFAKIDAVGTVFAFIPFMVVMMMAIVVAGMIAAGGNYHLLGSDFVRCRGRERGSQKKKTQIFGCFVQVILPYRELQYWSSRL